MNQPKTSKAEATPRPWKVQGNYIGSEGATVAECRVSSLLKEGEMEANQALIIQAVNEYDALNAVAEAAQNADCGCTVKERYSGHRSGCVMEAVHETLSTLATLRAKEGK